jgi:hypothetical protein
MCLNLLNCLKSEIKQKKVLKNIFFIPLFLFIASTGYGQEVRTKGEFLQDSIRIGEIVKFSLTARYPKGMDIVFPDSLYDYAPFDYVSRKYFPTKSDTITSFDSVVYYLTTFELQKNQSLSLPVYIIQRGDSIPVYASADSIVLTEVVREIPESPELREDILYREVDYPFNYPYLMMFIFVLSLTILIVYSIFGNKISKKIRLYKMKKDYVKFSKEFDKLIEDLKIKPVTEKTEQTLIFWKGYLEKLESIPYKKFTSKEIVMVTNEEKIKPALQGIDKKIYSSSYDEKVYQHFEVLKSFAKERFSKKTEEIKNV